MHPEYTSLYLYQFTGLLLIAVSGIKICLSESRIAFPTWTQSAIAIYGVYVISNGIWRGPNLNSYHQYLLISSLLAISLSVVLDNAVKVARVITYIAFLVAVICILQSVQILPSFSTYFEVTGTFSNPNITAMFLSLTLCAVPMAVSNASSSLKKGTMVIIVCILVALWLLQCRTAWIGLCVAGIIQLYYRYDLRKLFTLYTKSTLSVLAVIFGGLLLIALCLQGYKSKEASANGRILVWKLAAQLFAVEPIRGVGYGLFEKQYNIYQSGYFASGHGSSAERKQAGHVNMAYNELIQHGVEGGIIGAVLYAGIFVAVFFARPKKIRRDTSSPDSNHQAAVMAYSGIISFLTMGLFNFTMQAIPVMALFVIYLAVFIKNEAAAKKWSVNRSGSMVIGMLLILASSLVGYDVVKTASLAMTNKEIKMHHPNVPYWREKMDDIQSKLSGMQSYWISYGDMLLKERDFAGALQKYQIARQMSSDQDLYLNIAYCYQMLNQFEGAEKCYIFLKNMQPVWLLPRVSLLTIYQQKGDSDKSVTMAEEILSITPKVENEKSKTYQLYAQSILTKYNIPSAKQLKIPSLF